MDMADRDKALLAAVARGEGKALEQIYLRYKDDLLTLSAWMLCDINQAEAVLHDVFVSLARKAGQVQLTGPLKNYLCTSCLNRARDMLRR
jgi:DNA-directed RNA polymerase specialized sigma24 family protein